MVLIRNRCFYYREEEINMKSLYFIAFVSIALYIMSFYTTVYACVVTFFNNGTGPIFILDHNNPSNNTMPNTPASLTMVSRGSSRRIGKSDEHTHFSLYTKEPKGNTFI